MDGEILQAMAADLGMDRYIAESEAQYCNRVLYSALACWIKAAALDQPLAPVQEEAQGVSRRHILCKCTSVLNEMLKRFPESAPWFEAASDMDTPVSILLCRLIRHGDLLQVGFGTNLVLAESNRTALATGVECIKGEPLLRGTRYSGIAMMQRTGEDIVPGSRADEDVTTWFREYIRCAWWKTAGTEEDIQYFNARGKSGNNYSRWQSERPAAVEGIWLARRSVFQGGYEYFLLRQGDYLMKHRIDPFLQKMGEHRRFMMAMRRMVRNPALVRVCRHRDHISVKLNVRLPQRENSLLETYAWPRGSLTDWLEWDMDNCAWGGVEPQLCALGLVLTEEGESHGSIWGEKHI